MYSFSSSFAMSKRSCAMARVIEPLSWRTMQYHVMAIDAADTAKKVAIEAADAAEAVAEPQLQHQQQKKRHEERYEHGTQQKPQKHEQHEPQKRQKQKHEQHEPQKQQEQQEQQEKHQPQAAGVEAEAERSWPPTPPHSRRRAKRPRRESDANDENATHDPAVEVDRCPCSMAVERRVSCEVVWTKKQSQKTVIVIIGNPPRRRRRGRMEENEEDEVV